MTGLALQPSAMPPLRPAGADLVPTAASADLLAGAPRLVQAGTLAMVALILAFLAWASLAVIDEVTVAGGQIVPASRLQLVQSLEGGLIARILTREGALVEAGELILQIDPTGASADLEERRERLNGLSVHRAALKAELDGGELAIEPSLAASHADLVTQERRRLEATRRDLAAALEALDSQIAQRRQELAETHARIDGLAETLRLSRTELEMTRPLIAAGAAAKVDVIRLEGRISELSGDLETAKLSLPRLEAAIAQAISERDQRQASRRAEALTDLAKTEVDIAALEQAMRGQADRLARTDVRAPVRGIVKRLLVSTIGQVVRPAGDLVEIVPLDDTLLVQAKVTPRDVAFLKPGLAANVKVTAYDYTVYGTLAGRLEQIGADAVVNEKGESYYQIQVRTDRAYLERGGKRWPIMPGMVAEVDLLTGQKTVLDYLVRPLTRLRSEALRER